MAGLFAIDISHDGQHVETVAADSADAASNAAMAKLHRLQGQSADYAVTHGGWTLSDAYAATLRYVMGSAYFENANAATRYYAGQGYGEGAAAYVAGALKEGAIYLGKPPLQPGQAAQVDRAERRYFIAVYDRA